MKWNICLTAIFVTASLAVMQPAFQANSQDTTETAKEFRRLQALLKANKWYDANRETVSLVRNNPDNVTCPKLRRLDELWMKYSNGKYGFTPQLEIWKQVGGTNCETCEEQIKKFGKEVGWSISDNIRLIPGDFNGHYPTVAVLGWEPYVDTDKSLGRGTIFSGDRAWIAWRINGFNLFSTFAKCNP